MRYLCLLAGEPGVETPEPGSQGGVKAFVAKPVPLSACVPPSAFEHAPGMAGPGFELEQASTPRSRAAKATMAAIIVERSKWVMMVLP